MIKLLIVDDHAIVRQGIRQVVSETDDISVIDEAIDGRAALAKYRDCGADLVVLDISLPDISGLDVLKTIREDDAGLPVLILSMHAEEQYAVRALKAGASGYITKDSLPEELVLAIRKIAAQGKYVSQNIAEKLATVISRNDESDGLGTLSDREYQVMRLIAAGKTISGIADEMMLSVKTVSTYRHRIMEKLGLASTAEIIRYALDHEDR